MRLAPHRASGTTPPAAACKSTSTTETPSAHANQLKPTNPRADTGSPHEQQLNAANRSVALSTLRLAASRPQPAPTRKPTPSSSACSAARLAELSAAAAELAALEGSLADMVVRARTAASSDAHALAAVRSTLAERDSLIAELRRSRQEAVDAAHTRRDEAAMLREMLRHKTVRQCSS